MQNTLKRFSVLSLFAIALATLLFMFAPSVKDGVFSFVSSAEACCGSGGGGNDGGSSNPPRDNDRDHDDDDDDDDDKKPECSLSVSRNQIEKGESVTLSWSSKNVESVSINQGIGSVGKDGSKTVSPNQTTTYTGTFEGKNGKTVTCSKTVTVKIPPSKPAPTCDMWATPSTIWKGDSAVLAWNSTNANKASINQGIGSVSVDGSKTVRPDHTTTYTGTFEGEGGKTVTCSKTIKVEHDDDDDNEPTCELTASDTRIERGDKVKLAWESDYTSGGYINNGVGYVDENGSTNVYPRNTTTYTAEFYGDNGDEVTCKVKITVEEEDDKDDLSCKLRVSEDEIERGDRVKLSWESEGAAYGRIDNGVGRVDEEGYEYVYPTKDTTYKATFYGEKDRDDEVTCRVEVEVDGGYTPHPDTPYVTLSSVPYTGIDLGPVGNFVYWSFLVLWSVLLAYLIVVKGVHNAIAARLRTILFGEEEEEGVVAEPVVTRTAYTRPVAPKVPDMDPFLASQIWKKN